MRIGAGIVNLIGDFDLSDRTDVRNVFNVVKPPVHINLEKTTFIDAAILGELARLAKRVSPHRPTLIAPCPAVRRILDVVEFDRLFDYS